ncbi:hypothetical protein GCM10027037_17600 [Mucilaginibacter koreensis]
MPPEYKRQDTLGQQILSGNSLYGYIMIIRSANPPGKPLKYEKDLKKELKNYQKKVVASSGKGTVEHDHDTLINNNLIARDFTLKIDTGSGVQDRQFRLVYTKNYTYTFQYLLNDAQQEVAAKEMKAFFGSIKFDESIDRNDQYTTIGQFTGMHKGLRMGLIAGGVLIIGLIIWLIMRRKRNTLQA